MQARGTKGIRGASTPAVQQWSTVSSEVVDQLGRRVFQLLKIEV